jgi:hypothetical protein
MEDDEPALLKERMRKATKPLANQTPVVKLKRKSF